MADIPEAIKKHLHELGLSREQACWEARSGKWAVKHFACERIAAKLGIKFDEPKPLAVGPDFVSLCVTGRLGDLSEWSVGEASGTTTQNKYFCAMAEKRAKDRVILKLIGVHGQVYAEDEADDFTEQGQALSDAKGSLEYLMRHNDVVRENIDSIHFIKEYIKTGDVAGVAQIWLELSNEIKEALWVAPTKGGVFTTEERAFLKSDEFAQARKEAA